MGLYSLSAAGEMADLADVPWQRRNCPS